MMPSRPEPPSHQAREASRRSILLLGLASGAALFVGLSGLGGCEEESSAGAEELAVLADLAELVAKPMHAELAAAALTFDDAVASLAEDVTTENLAAAATSWRAVQLAWYRLRSLGFGPTKAVEANIRWSLGCDAEKVEATIAAGAPFDPPKLGTSQKGLPTLEYLLFSLEGAEAIVELLTGSEARRAFLVALSKDLKSEVDALASAWTTHADELARAGEGSTVYKAPKDAMDALFNQLVYASDLAIALLGDPLGINATAPQPELEEARLSDNTLDDALALVDGVEAVYLGDHGGQAGLGITDLVAERSASLDGDVKSAIAAARAALSDVPPPLRLAIEGDAAKVTAAVEALRAVKRVLTADVATALGVTISFSDMDGD